MRYVEREVGVKIWRCLWDGRFRVDDQALSNDMQRMKKVGLERFLIVIDCEGRRSRTYEVWFASVRFVEGDRLGGDASLAEEHTREQSTNKTA